MEESKPSEPEDAVEFLHNALVIAGKIVAGGEHVCRIDADAQTILELGPDTLEQNGQLLETLAERAALTRSAFEKYRHIPADAQERPAYRRSVATQPGRAVSVGCVAGMGDQEIESERLAALEFSTERAKGPFPKPAIRAGEVDQVGIVGAGDDDAVCLRGGSKRGRRVPIHVTLRPPVHLFGEDLDDPSADLGAASRRPIEATGRRDVSA